MVIWRSHGGSGNDTHLESIQAQCFRGDGRFSGRQFQVNTYSTSSQTRPAVAVEPDGDFVVSWDSNGTYGTDTSSLSVQVQPFAKLILYDGFESGDLTAWSNIVQ